MYFQYENKRFKAWPIDPLGLRNIQLEASERDNLSDGSHERPPHSAGARSRWKWQEWQASQSSRHPSEAKVERHVPTAASRPTGRAAPMAAHGGTLGRVPHIAAAI